MNENIAKKLKELPNKSGVYIMHGIDGTVIYVGKAKNLKNRVSSYFNNSEKAPKVMAMVENVEWFEYIITPSELDAFTLENNLIKKHQPFYNILLKDSKTFPYIKVDVKSAYPHFSVCRRVEKDECKYFGPFLAGVSANHILDFINKYFKLRTCKNNLVKEQKRECVNYQMGLCCAPCTRKVTVAEYKKLVDRAIEFLKGNDEDVVADLTQKMNNFADAENFEKAIEMRQTIGMIKKLGNHSIANLPKKVNRDAISYVSNEITSAIAVLSVRGGRILGVQSFSITDASFSAGEVLENFITTYYQNAIIPKELILSHDIDSKETIKQFFGKNVEIILNPKALNLKLLKMAQDNAVEHLEKNLTRDRLKYDNTLGAIKALKEKLGLKKIPMRMECYDISHVQGTNKVASMVVFVGGEAKKSDYRKFIIKTVKGNDDFACLKEALTRRLLRLKNGDGESFKERPDLLVIDGGKGQLSSCEEVLAELGMQDIEIVSLAKRIEEVFVPGKDESVKLSHYTAPLKLLQRLRDEAHRVAITFHRQRRGKGMIESALDGIAGLGPKKKAELIKAYDNVEEIKKASIDDLVKVKGITIKLANNILSSLQQKFKG